MMRRFTILCLLAMAAGTAQAAPRRAAAPAPTPSQLLKADVLPLSLDDSFEFRKKKLFLLDPEVVASANDKMLAFERDRLFRGAVTQEERNERKGHYFTFWWRTARPAHLRVRLEYRQAHLGNYVQAKEITLNAGKGTHKTEFQITGDEYHQDGRVLAWRAVLIEGDRIVALTQSFLWH